MKKRGVAVISIIIFLVLISSAFALDGCYYYPKSSKSLYCQKITEEKALADYKIKALGETKQYTSFFNPGKDCSGIPTCKSITCSVNCQTMTQGECQLEAEKQDKGKETGWQEVTETNYNDWCSAGCCKVSNTCYYQQSGGTKWNCLNIAKKEGLTTFESWITKLTDPTMDSTKCSQSCGVKTNQVTLKGTILDQNKNPLSGVKIELKGKTQTTSSTGIYSFQNDPGTHLIKLIKSGYITINQPITLKTNQTTELNFTLKKLVGTAQLSGYVKDKDGKPLNRVLISWKSTSTSGSVLSDKNGFYTAKNLVPKEKYIFTLAKYGYTTKDQSYTLKTQDDKKNFLLETTKLQGIKGYVWLDKDGDNIGDEKIYGASISVNGIFKSYSQYSPLGYYQLELSTGSQEISATYSDYELKKKLKINLQSGETKTQDLLLTKYIGQCSYGGKNQSKSVEKFTANHIKGVKKISLQWTKPCPEVSAYQIVKFKNGKQVAQFSASPAMFSYLDDQVEWGGKYSYQITAVYTDVKTRFSTPVKISVTMGDQICENQYSEKAGWATFCSNDLKDRKKMWSCNNQNKKTLSKDCSVLDTKGSAYYCAEITSTTATCKDAGKCSLIPQAATPFGLYYNRQTCYGVKSTTIKSGEPTNYCYYDYTQSVVNKCDSCANIKSCFDYQSKDACDINNCLGTTCNWVSAGTGLNIYKNFENILSLPILEETGHGYCVEKDYKKDDQCKSCSASSSLFENYYCTSSVCSQLGRCFSYYDLTECKSCGTQPDKTHNCYSYSTQTECVGDQPLKNSLGTITSSKDQCGWGKCVWKGQAKKFDEHGCIKDGDGDGKDDCSQFTAGETTLCQIDNQAPTTSILPAGKVKIVSLSQTNLTFQGTDNESRLGVLGYCLADSKSNTPKCTSFQETKYPGKLNTEIASADIVKALQGKIIKGETYRLRYYSKDRYFNQETVREEFIFIDTEKPQFQIKSNYTTTIDKTDLTIYLTGINEPMGCEFKLDPLLPKSTLQTKKITRQEKNKQAIFKSLPGIIYNLTINCIDDYNNKNTQNKQFVFDLEPAIDIIYPKGPITTTSPYFQLKTATKATCSLYDAKNLKVADFTADTTNKKHKTKSLSLKTGNYSGTYKAICKDLLTQKIKEDFFIFQIDISGPKTNIVLTEGNRTVIQSTKGWKSIFVDSAKISSFKYSVSGFGYNKTFYCLGSGCASQFSSGYKEFTKPVSLNKSTQVCYYSVDTGGNKETPPNCGQVSIEGFGINLVSPTPYSYNGEKWGISYHPNFSLVISTKVPTSSCRFDFNPIFNYEKVPSHQKLKKTKSGGNYYYNDGTSKFPGKVISTYNKKGGIKTIFVKCKDLGNKLGPVQKINLEYDPTKPVIKKAYAQPASVNEGVGTNLFIETDDKTICKYNDGKATYSSMIYPFPGVNNKTLNTKHTTWFRISFGGTKKTYNLVTQCKNGAGNVSEPKNITFTVDYSVQGNILSTSPKGYVSGTAVKLGATTNKRAICKYNTTTFKTTGSTKHQHSLGKLTEGKYYYLIKCNIAGEKREGKIEFIVDQTPPKITSVNDQKYSCGLSDTPKIYVYTDEGNLSSYYYELYEVTNSSVKKIVSKGSLAATSPFKIKYKLTKNGKYFIKVKATDKAGNTGTLVESDGFLAVDSKYSECNKDVTAPVVSFQTNDTCSAVEVEMKCTDETSCDKFDYYQSSVEGSCKPAFNYNGQKISLKRTEWICYYVADPKGNNKTRTTKITFKDSDGDGVTDSCDKCASTTAGKYVDSTGCASGQTTTSQSSADTDGDGLPDSWEKLYNDQSTKCYLDYLKKDSDGDGITDDKEDYDTDNYSNYEEYSGYYDPCYADAPKKTITKKPTTTTKPTTTKTTTKTSKSSLLAWIILSLGIILVLGGSGYLVFYYESVHGPGKPMPAKFRGPAPPSVSQKPKPTITSWKHKIFGLRRVRAKKEKTQVRKSLFGEFSQESKTIPHLNPLLNKEIPHQERVGQLAQKYVEKKETIRPGLKHGEKGVFAKLENIATKTQDKPVHEVVSKGEAKSIFDKLKKISDERKK